MARIQSPRPALPLAETGRVVSTVPDGRVSRNLLHGFSYPGHRGRVAVTAQSASEGDALRRAGADLVLLEFADAAVDRLLLAEAQDAGTGS